MSNLIQQGLHGDNARRRFGLECAKIRTRKGRSRLEIAYQLRSYLGENNPLSISIGEVYIGRIENGLVVKLHREIVEGLVDVLSCTRQEQARLLLYADLNIVGGYAEDEVAELINYFTAYLFREAHVTLQGLYSQRRAQDLSEAELHELVVTAISLIRRQHIK